MTITSWRQALHEGEKKTRATDSSSAAGDWTAQGWISLRTSPPMFRMNRSPQSASSGETRRTRRVSAEEAADRKAA